MGDASLDDPLRPFDQFPVSALTSSVPSHGNARSQVSQHRKEKTALNSTEDKSQHMGKQTDWGVGSVHSVWGRIRNLCTFSKHLRQAWRCMHQGA